MVIVVNRVSWWSLVLVETAGVIVVVSRVSW